MSSKVQYIPVARQNPEEANGEFQKEFTRGHVRGSFSKWCSMFDTVVASCELVSEVCNGCSMFTFLPEGRMDFQYMK